MDGDQSQCAQSKNFLPSYVASGNGAFGDFTSNPLNDLDGDEEGFVNVPNDQSDIPSENDKLKSVLNAPGTKKLTSDVWLYLDVVMVNGVRKAQCKSCKKYLSNNIGNGVSHLCKHATKSCSLRLLANDSSQTKLRTKIELDGSSTLELKEKFKEFDQDFSRSKLVTAIEMIFRNTLKNDILKMYKDDKISLQRLLEHNDSRVAVTTDIWTSSNQKKGYMVVTSHFIDQNWVLRNRTLRLEGTSACSIVNEDLDLEGKETDIIDMDVNDIPIEDMEEEEQDQGSSLQWW